MTGESLCPRATATFWWWTVCNEPSQKSSVISSTRSGRNWGGLEVWFQFCICCELLLVVQWLAIRLHFPATSDNDVNGWGVFVNLLLCGCL
jgi:hypothetical protein